jgi:CDP-diacylglycerol---glycerol-3-phosphate 3-phosphatidyltransferase
MSIREQHLSSHRDAVVPALSRIRGYLPNALTISRILLIPVFVGFFLTPTPERSLAAAAVFGLAALTDAVDGYLARRWGKVTNLGKLLDPFADKLLVLTALFLLVDFERVDAWVAIVLAGREFFITALRFAAAREGVTLAAETIGKYKMILQVIAILLLIINDAVPAGLNFQVLGTAILLLSMVLSVISAAQYCRQFINQVLPRLAGRHP